MEALRNTYLDISESRALTPRSPLSPSLPQPSTLWVPVTSTSTEHRGVVLAFEMAVDAIVRIVRWIGHPVSNGMRSLTVPTLSYCHSSLVNYASEGQACL